jgi:hypothetical protein
MTQAEAETGKDDAPKPNANALARKEERRDDRDEQSQEDGSTRE